LRIPLRSPALQALVLVLPLVSALSQALVLVSTLPLALVLQLVLALVSVWLLVSDRSGRSDLCPQSVPVYQSGHRNHAVLHRSD